MRLRPFSLVSNTLAYTHEAAEFRFPTTPKGNARCAIVGIRARATGAEVSSRGIWPALLQRLTVAGRNYIQGDVPLGLIAGAIPAGTAGETPTGTPRINYFPGSHIPLPGGVMAAGMALGPQEEVFMRIERFSDEAYPTQIVLDCVQWPDDPNDPMQALWDRLRHQGIGEAQFVGQVIAGWPGAGVETQLEAFPQPPSARALRRWGFRGTILDAVGRPAAYEYVPAGSAGMNNLAVEVWSDFQRAPMNQMAPARAVLGLPGYDPATGLVDLRQNERSLINVLCLGTAVAAAEPSIYVVHMFEGRDVAAPVMDAATAVS